MDSEPSIGSKPCDNDSLAARLRKVGKLGDILATTHCPVKGHSLVEVIGINPPLSRADPATAVSTQEGATKPKRRVVETTPKRKDKTKEPTQSPGDEATMVDQIKPLQAWELQLMNQTAGAIIRQNSDKSSLADLTGIPIDDPKGMMFALTGLISEDPAEQREEVMEEIMELTLGDPLEFNTLWADIAAMKSFLDNIPGAKETKEDKKKWAKLLQKKFERAFPDIKMVTKMRKFNKTKAMKAEEIVQLAKMGYQEARKAHKNKRKQVKQQQVMVQKLGMQAKRYRMDGTGNGFNKFGYSEHDYAGEPDFRGDQCGPGGYGWNRQSPPTSAFRLEAPHSTPFGMSQQYCKSCQELLKKDDLDTKTRARLLKSINKHSIETCIQSGGMMEGKSIQEAWARSDEIKAQKQLKSTAEVSAKQLQIEPAEMASNIWSQIKQGLVEQD
jgi:hypothetical protein